MYLTMPSRHLQAIDTFWGNRTSVAELYQATDLGVGRALRIRWRVGSGEDLHFLGGPASLEALPSTNSPATSSVLDVFMCFAI